LRRVEQRTLKWKTLPLQHSISFGRWVLLQEQHHIYTGVAKRLAAQLRDDVTHHKATLSVKAALDAQPRVKRNELRLVSHRANQRQDKRTTSFGSWVIRGGTLPPVTNQAPLEPHRLA
jgi:hypothetical protein